MVPQLVQKLGLIGDVHTERTLLACTLELLRTQNVDCLACTGDLPDGFGDAGDVDRCCELLRENAVLTVEGNHDRWLLAGKARELADATTPAELAAGTIEYLRGLPKTIELATPQGDALLCHGLGTDDMARLMPFDVGYALETNDALNELLSDQRYRYLLNGHSHRAMVRRIEGLTVINAGTLRRDHQPRCAVVDFVRCTVTWFAVNGTDDVVPIGENALP